LLECHYLEQAQDKGSAALLDEAYLDPGALVVQDYKDPLEEWEDPHNK
jgi:hypothetical protein